MLKGLFSKNIGKKFIALILSISLWFIANIEQDIERKISLVVNYSNLPTDLIVINKPPENLNLTVRGPRSQLSSISTKDLSFSLDLASVSTGISKFEIRTEQIKAPRGVQVIGLSPAEIKLDIDRLVEKRVAVIPVIGPPDTGYEIVGNPKVDLKTVIVVGPNKVLYNLKTVMTDLISISGAESKFTIEVPFKPPPLVEVKNVETVKVTVDVVETTSVKEIRDVDIEYKNFGDLEYSANSDYKVELTFEGPYSLIKELNEDKISVYVDGKEMTPNPKKKTYLLKVHVKYPNSDEIKLTKERPKKIKITLN